MQKKQFLCYMKLSLLHFEKSVEPVLSFYYWCYACHDLFAALLLQAQGNTDDVGVCIASNCIITLNVSRSYTISRYVKQIGADRLTLDFENNSI